MDLDDTVLLCMRTQLSSPQIRVRCCRARMEESALKDTGALIGGTRLGHYTLHQHLKHKLARRLLKLQCLMCVKS